MKRIDCFGCYSTEPCTCSDAWKQFCKYARDEAWKVKLPTLASNLRIGAALCRAHLLGDPSVRNWLGCSSWKPGCGRSAP